MLLLALAAQFACDFAASVVARALYGGPCIRELVAEYRPVYPIDLALSPLGLAVAFATIVAHSQLALLLIAPLFGMLRFFSRERHERLAQLAELNDAYQGTALLLGDVVEADDTYTGEHCKGVVRLSLEVARELGLDADRQRNVEFGALLHDVGKIAVPKEIINKPGKLDEREWAIIKTHTIEGQRMLETIGGFMSEIGRIVRASHERWDGSGYPDGLRGEAIPLEARIVSACDAFNAMTTTRSYRKAMPLADACARAAALRRHAVRPRRRRRAAARQRSPGADARGRPCSVGARTGRRAARTARGRRLAGAPALATAARPPRAPARAARRARVLARGRLTPRRAGGSPCTLRPRLRPRTGCGLRPRLAGCGLR